MLTIDECLAMGKPHLYSVIANVKPKSGWHLQSMCCNSTVYSVYDFERNRDCMYCSKCRAQITLETGEERWNRCRLELETLSSQMIRGDQSNRIVIVRQHPLKKWVHFILVMMLMLAPLLIITR